MNKKLIKIEASIISFTLIFLAFLVITPSATPVILSKTKVYKSDTNDYYWTSAASSEIDGCGYIVPPVGATWKKANYCWEHSNWNPSLTPVDRKASLFASPAADWIWGPVQGPDNKVTTASSYTGEIVFFKKQINIPALAFDIQADLFVITADNAYYFYVNNVNWTGSPDGIAGFNGGYNPTNFYYTSDGVNNLGGGTNSVPYETVGNLYPLEAAINGNVGAWSSIELYDITSMLHTGANCLQIVGINEHAPPQTPDDNPAGLIYKVIVKYKVPVEVEVEKEVWDDDTSSWVKEIRVPVGTELKFRSIITNIGGIKLNNLEVKDVLSKQLEYRNNANIPETSVSTDLRTIIWNFNELCVGQSIEIIYYAESVMECYGSNTALVTTRQGTIDKDLVKVKVHQMGQPVMDIEKFVWDSVHKKWDDSTKQKLDENIKFKLQLTSTALNEVDVSIIDNLPENIEYLEDANIQPKHTTQNKIEWEFSEVQPGETFEIIYNARPISEGLTDSLVTLQTSDSNSDSDSVLLNIVDAPDITLHYPIGGETLNGVVTLLWESTDNKDVDLETTKMYYKNINDDQWTHITDVNDGNNQYCWDTTNVPDGNYQIQVITQDSDELYAYDTSDLFLVINNENTNPPSVPDCPDGQIKVGKDKQYVYSTKSTDMDSDKIYYLFDWGDEHYSEWLGPYKSGEKVRSSHVWDESGEYNIRVKAKDSTGIVSDWSDSLEITVTEEKTIFERLIENFMQQLQLILKKIFPRLI